jgi:glycosyltransferase involved in cell wall biosynthesis
MNILIFEQRYTDPQEAGIGRFYYFAKEWLEAGHKVTIIAGKLSYLSGQKLPPLKSEENFKVLRVFDSTLGYRTFLGRLWSYFSYWFLALITSLFLKKPDVVIASSPPIFTGFLGFLVSRLKKASFVFEVRDIWPDEAIELGFLKNKILIRMSYWLEKFLYKKADFLVTNSPGIREFLIKEKNVGGEKIVSIPNPVDINLFSFEDFSLRQERRWTDKIVVLYSGAHSAVYDLDLVLDVAKEIKDEPFVFVFLGDGRQKRALIERAEKENIKNVLFLEPVSKIKTAEYIFAADICVAPLKKKKLLQYVYATKLFDYMAGARPIILAGEGVSRRLVCDEARCGICVLPEDRTAFQEALLNLANDPVKREKYGKNGWEYLFKNFRSEQLANRYLEILQKISEE